MWVYTPNIDKTIQVTNPEFEFFHHVTDGWRNVSSGEIIFEAHGAFWRAPFPDQTDMQFSSGVFVASSGFLPLVKEGDNWIWYNKHREAQWVVDGNRTFEGNWIADLSTNTLLPHNVRSGSPANTRSFTRLGTTLIKSDTLMGDYDGNPVGWRHYQHDELDSDNNPNGNLVDVYESVGLVDTEGVWTYTYKGKSYEHFSTLPLSDFEMIGLENNLQMTYVGLVALDKTTIGFDGGAQNVD